MKIETIEQYQEYLKSSSWDTRKKQAIQHYKKCIICANKDNLNVHLNDFSRANKEQLNDLAVLCERCYKVAQELRPLGEIELFALEAQSNIIQYLIDSRYFYLAHFFIYAIVTAIQDPDEFIEVDARDIVEDYSELMTVFYQFNEFTAYPPNRLLAGDSLNVFKDVSFIDGAVVKFRFNKEYLPFLRYFYERLNSDYFKESIFHNNTIESMIYLLCMAYEKKGYKNFTLLENRLRNVLCAGYYCSVNFNTDFEPLELFETKVQDAVKTVNANTEMNIKAIFFREDITHYSKVTFIFD